MSESEPHFAAEAAAGLAHEEAKVHKVAGVLHGRAKTAAPTSGLWQDFLWH